MNLTNLAHSFCLMGSVNSIMGSISCNGDGTYTLVDSGNGSCSNLSRKDAMNLLLAAQLMDVNEITADLIASGGENTVVGEVDLSPLSQAIADVTAAVNQRRVVGYIPISRYVQEGSGIEGEYGGTLGEPQQTNGFSYCQQYVLLLWSDGVVTELDGTTVVDLNTIQDMVGYCQTLGATPDNTEHLYVLADGYRSPDAPAPVIKPF